MKAKIVSIILVSMLLLGAFVVFTPQAEAAPTKVKVYPAHTTLGPASAIGTTLDFAVVVEDVANLYGFDIKFRWNTTYFDYVSKTIGYPVETHGSPMPPSPYAGILHEPYTVVKDIVYPVDGWYHAAVACLSPAPVFTGSGTVFTMRFLCKKHDYEFVPDQTLLFDFIDTKLSDQGATAIPHDREIADVLMIGRPVTYPPVPLLDVRTPEGKTYAADALNEEFNADIYLLGDGGTALDPMWDVQGFDFYVSYDTALLDVVSATIDPVGTFAGFWPGGIFQIAKTVDEAGGKVRMAFLGLPSPTGHSAPYGTIRLATVRFKVTFESETYPPPTCLLHLEDPKPTITDPDWLAKWPYPAYWMVKIAGFPHPELMMNPWDGLPWSPPLPVKVSDATYKAPFKPPGRWIDVYTEYPYPFGGQGPNQPSDSFGPQFEITLYAEVTYNFDPVQQKRVTFEITSPTGEFHWIRTAITDTNGIATVSVRIPWPCEDPETRIFGIWNVIGTVEIAEVVINDTLTFEVGYLINIVSVDPLADAYAKGEHMGFKITYNSIHAQPLDCLFWVVVYDDLGVAIGYRYVLVEDIVKGTGYEIVLDCMTVPKWAYVGQGTVYANALTKLPSEGGAAYCPERSAIFGIIRAP